MKDVIEQAFAEWKASWRFRWVGLGVAWLLFFCGLAAVLLMPDTYESRAQMYVDTTSILRPLLQGIAVTGNTQDEADIVRRALLARPMLEKVVKETELSRRASTPEKLDQAIKQLSKDLVASGDSRSNLYQISYKDHSPQLAQAVVRVLLDSFVESASGANRNDTGNAQEFLRLQVADYASRLSATEQRLVEFKKKHIGLMPDQRGDYFGRLQTELATLEKLKTDLIVAERERDALRKKITGDARNSDHTPVAMPSDKEIQAATSLDSRIQESHRQLDELLLKYTDKHPDVIAMRDTLMRLEARRQADLGNIRQTNAGLRADGGAEADTVMQDLEIKLNTADVQVAALQAQVERSDERVAELRSLVTTTPEVEAELAQMNRDYGVTKAEYEALLQRLESAKISGQAGKSDELKFRIIEAPRVPTQPVSPPRLLIMLFLLPASITGGGLVAYLLNLGRPVFMSAAALQKATGLMVIGVVSRPMQSRERLRQLRERFAYGIGAGLLVVVFGISIAFGQSGSRLIRTSLGME